MHPLVDLKWTTRAEVCERLWEFVQQSSPATAPDPDAKMKLRLRVAELFCLLAAESDIPGLRQLLLYTNGDHTSRRATREALVRLKAELPPDELAVLLRHEFHPETTRYWDLADILELFRTEETQATARAILASWAPEERARLLHQVRLSYPPQELVAWLYEKWLSADRPLVESVENDGEPINYEIAWRTSERSESMAILVDHWRRAEGEQREEARERLWDFDEGVPAHLVAANPAELAELAHTFILTKADLVEYFGAEPLLKIVEEKLRGISRARFADPDDYSPIHEWEFKRIVELMAEWPEPGVRDQIRSLFCCPDIETEVRWEFCHSLWKEHRDTVLSLALAAGQQAGDFELPARVLRWVVDDPQSGDRELLRWSAWQEGYPQLPYWALQGLERLGEDSKPWRERLAELARSEDPFVRLQAAAALARRGDEARRAEIVREAEAAEDPCVRAEAIRVLGELGGDQHLDLFQQALWADGPVYTVRDDPDDASRYSTFLPTAEEGALALARVGTPEALTALIQAYLVLPYGDPRFAAGEYLETIVARMEGKSEPFGIMPWTGWRQERFGRLP